MSLPHRSVCLDAQGAQSHEHHDRGIARYVVEHTRALHRAAPEVLHSVLLNPGLPLAGSLDWLLGKRCLGWASGDRRISPRPATPPEIYHVMSPFELQQPLDTLWPSWARSGGVRTVVTLYDTIPLVFPEHYLGNPVIRARYLTRARLVQDADEVLAISGTTAGDAVEHLGVPEKRISVINAGATTKFAGMYASAEDARRVLGTRWPELREGFMLYVAGFEFRKNLERVIAAYGLIPLHIRAAHQLVIACRLLPSEAAMLDRWARDAGIERGQLVLTGYVTDPELGALYRASGLFVFGSIYEGSGLPILEAMSCGAPVAASNTSTGPEILGDREGTFDPYSPQDIARCLSQTVTDEQLLERLRERSRRRVAGYTWASVAERSLQAYESVLGRSAGERRRRRVRVRPRIALVSPWPPERSGVADYSYRLARALGEHADVDVVVGQDLDRYAPPQEHGVRLFAAGSFSAGQTVRQPDRVLYCMGNSSFHGHVYELLRHRPGAVLAHDVRLTGFYGWFSGRESPEDPAGRLAERIKALYGTRLPKSVLSESPPSWQRQASLGIYMTGEIQEYAEQMFVHSRHAREVLELDRAALQRVVPVEVMPFGLPARVAAARHESHAVDGSPLLLTSGVVSEVKGLELLIAAAAALARQRSGLRVMIVGPGEPAELERWRGVARELAPGTTVELTGHVSADRYAELLARADMAVQLRTLSNGEASAAVADCLAAGVPTVVTDIGWASELPAGVAARVPVDASAGALAELLDSLLGDVQARCTLSEEALEYARGHSFENVARDYLQALELV